MNTKRTGLFVVAAGLAILMLVNILPAMACGGGSSTYGFDDPRAPKALVMAAFGVVNKKLNAQLTPDGTPWQWSEEVFANSALECPAANQAVDQALTHGYIVTVSVLQNDGSYVDYYFHATSDGQTFFQCTNTGPGPRISVSA